MKYSNVIILLIGISLLFSFATQTSKKLNENGTLGDVKYSVLDIKDFKTVNGCGWEQLKGQQLSTTSGLYNASTSKRFLDNGNLPNADGMFIRSVDTNTNDSLGDPDASLRKNKIGSYQADTLGSHSHKYVDRYYQRGGGTHTRNSGYRSIKGSDRTTDETGDVETRPQNINLYTYIKINNDCK